MAEKGDIEAFQALTSGKKGKTETARLRELLGYIEAAIGAGVRREAIFETLKERGFTFSFDSFVTILQRLRKRNAAQGVSQTPFAPVGTNPTPPRTNTQLIPQPGPRPSSVAAPPAPSTQQPYETKTTDKDREKYDAFLESIKHLSEKEQRREVERYLVARRGRL